LASQGTFFNYPDTFKAAKMTKLLDGESLEHEHGWLNYYKRLVDSELVMLPKPSGPLITSSLLIILVMDCSINGEAVEDEIQG